MGTPDAWAALRNVDGLRSSEEAGLGELVAESRRRTYSRHEGILGPAAPSAAVVVVAEGVARLFRSSAAGGEVEMGRFGPGDLVGPLRKRNRNDVAERDHLEAWQDGTVAYTIPSPVFRHFLAQHPDVALWLLDERDREAARARDRIEDLALYPMRVRLAHELLHRSDRDGRVPASHDELAANIGSQRSEVSRELGRFRQLGWIESTPHRRGLVVLRPEALAHVSE